jgi:hypothetical protein
VSVDQVEVRDVAITTDDNAAAANTGRTGRLSKLRKDHAAYGLTKVWFWCYQSDLAIQPVFEIVLEVKQ